VLSAFISRSTRSGSLGIAAVHSASAIQGRGRLGGRAAPGSDRGQACASGSVIRQAGGRCGGLSPLALG
jgi:hypothetical protein